MRAFHKLYGLPETGASRPTQLVPQLATHNSQLTTRQSPVTPGVSTYLVISSILFTLGTMGVLVRRDPLIIFMSIELMLNSVNLTLVAFSHYLQSADGLIFVFMIMTVAAAEVVVGLALIVSIFRTRQDIDVDDLDAMKG